MMKALIISDDKNLIDFFGQFFNKNGIETIVYGWFLKALDNVEEIRPDLMVINGEEYPRHWKILAQFASDGNVTGKKIPVYVYSPNEIDCDEENKFKVLKNAVRIESLDKNSLAVMTENDQASEISENSQEKTESFKNVSPIVLRALVNSNSSRKIVVGNLIFNSFGDMKIKFIPDFSDDASLFSAESFINDSFYEYEKDCIPFCAKVLSVCEDDEKHQSVEMEFLE